MTSRSILPSTYGEKVVMRLTSSTALTRSKSELGLRDWELRRFDHMLSNPTALSLVTGPTGSGKSTTLYTALSELNSEEVKSSPWRTLSRQTYPASTRCSQPKAT
jgi:type IV pilus assembly protein PilB